MYKIKEVWRLLKSGWWTYEVSNYSRVRTIKYKRFIGKELASVPSKMLIPIQNPKGLKFSLQGKGLGSEYFANYLAELCFSEEELKEANPRYIRYKKQ